MGKPKILKGTRDFSPLEVNRRNYIFGTIRKVFVKYGYQPLETPSIESLDTLMGKYGEEGDQLLFKVLNNGDFLGRANSEALEARDSRKALTSLSKRGLRYDLTVPFARYVVMNQSDIAFPFKRYQIQPVWRADRPQKGRYNEFYQCDVDVVGSESLIYEAELIQIYDEVFTKLGLDVKIRINNRKILEGIAEACGIADKMVEMTVALDKLDKIGVEKVIIEMTNRDISLESAQQVMEIIKMTTLKEIEDAINTSEIGTKGVDELRQFHTYFDLKKETNEVVFDVTLARGLSYYTGCIFEVEAKDVEIGSIGGGGRYDNLTETFGLKDVSGVGVSFGVARIYLAMEEKGLFPADTTTDLDVLILIDSEEALLKGLQIISGLRNNNIIADIYPDPNAKSKKQFKYAQRRGTRFIINLESRDLGKDKWVVKNMKTREHLELGIEEITERVNG